MAYFDARNDCRFTGFVTKQPELMPSKAGGKYCRFSLAVHISKEKSLFVTFTSLETKQAEMLAQRLKKGSEVTVCAQYDESKYTNAAGETKYSHTFIVTSVVFHRQPGDVASNVPDHEESRTDEFMAVDDAGLPFN